MARPGLSELRLTYKQAVVEWVESIHAEEALAVPDHSMVAMDRWDAARRKEQGAAAKAAESREAYKDALRKIR